MGLPDVTETIQDGALGIVGDVTDNVCVKVGVSSQGAVNTLFGFGDKKSLVTTLGTGPLVDAAALSLDTAGGPVYCVRANTSAPGVVGRVSHLGTQTSALTVAGPPLDQYDVQVAITRDAASIAANAAAFT